MLVQCNWKTCVNNKDGMCKAEAVKLQSFDYEKDNEEFEGLQCSAYKYNPVWMNNNES